MKNNNLKIGVHLIPAVLTIALILGCASRPELEKIPERLEPTEEEMTIDMEEEELETGEIDVEDGTYTGSAEGYGGPIKVEVTVKDHQISEIAILDASKETDSFFQKAKGVIDEILRLQSWDVDVVSGATYSSNGIKAAVENALTGNEVKTEKAKTSAGGNSSALKKVSYTAPSGGYKDGTYTGSAQGFGGTIGVSVTISGGKITAVNVTSASGETASYLSSAKGVISRILSKQTPNVDTVSGATYSSNGILNAVKNALSKAGGTTGSKNSSSSSGTAKPNYHYKDGTYTGTGEGYGGPIKVTVTVKNGQITKVNIDSAAEETPAYLNRAKALLTTITEKQVWNLDAVSGATYSSEGILEAVSKAMASAGTSKSETTSQPQTSRSYADGTYTGSGTGYKGSRIRVQVTIKNGKITAIEILEAEKEGDLYKKAASGTVAAILNRQDWDVDSISGATFTSNGIKEAVAEALNKADKSGTKTAPTPVPVATVSPSPSTTPSSSTTPTPTPTPQITEKVYTATATVSPDEYKDFGPYEITVSITVQTKDGVDTIISAEVSSSTNRTNKKYLDTAWNSMKSGLMANNAADAVSGATCSSKAIQSAWSQAMSR